MRKNETHRDFIRSLACICCDENTTVECAHIRFSDARIAKFNPGHNKPNDAFTLPLCGYHHRRQHQMNEREFWRQASIDPIIYALALYAASGDYEQGCRILEASRMFRPPLEAAS